MRAANDFVAVRHSCPETQTVTSLCERMVLATSVTPRSNAVFDGTDDDGVAAGVPENDHLRVLREHLLEVDFEDPLLDIAEEVGQPEGVQLCVELAAGGLVGCGDVSQPAQNTFPTTPPASATGYPVTITNCDKTYTYQRAPQRVVTGWPTTVDTLSDLGIGRSVVGYVSGEFGPPPRDIKPQKLSDKYVPPTETILAARPDFFLANGDSQLSGESGSITRTDLEKIAPRFVMSS